jgi:hypothetical protein
MLVGGDADNDGVPDSEDSCPATPEDVDGEADLDGCPESDLSLNVEKEHQIAVNISQPTRFTVTAVATNGNYPLLAPNGIKFIEQLSVNVTDPSDKCEVAWLSQAGDQDWVDLVWDDWAGTGFTDLNGNTVPDQGEPGVELILVSLLQRTVADVPAFADVHMVREYEVTCNSFGTHQTHFLAGVVPTYPVSDPNVLNNVHRQFIDILVPTSTPAPTPIPDYDGDGVADGSDNCPAWPNADQSLPPWPVPSDDPDCDGFPTFNENFMGTLPMSACPAIGVADGIDNDGDTTVDEPGEGANDEDPDPLPSDANDDQNVDVGDIIILFSEHLLNPSAYIVRSDFDADGDIDMGDVIAAFSGRILTSCT